MNIDFTILYVFFRESYNLYGNKNAAIFNLRDGF
jgi:hypothetical protein